jgi:capsular polysaccharide export protein
MKVLTTTFYSDFTRYFNYLEDCFEKNIKNIEFYNISIYPSAHYQWKKYNKHSILLPSFVLKNHKRNHKFNNLPKVYKEINLDEIISFSYKTQIMFGRDEKTRLKQQAIRYIDFFEKLFKENKFDLYISSGDSRMLIQITDYFAKINNVKTFYFEQGPFGTTIIDEKGVNCNISFIDKIELDKNIDSHKTNLYIQNYYKNKPLNYWKNPPKSLYEKYISLLTFFWMYPPKLLYGFFPIDTQMGSSFWNNKKQQIINRFSQKFNKNKVTIKRLPEKYIVFVMQMPTDAQLIENSPMYDSFYEMIQDIYNSIPRDYKLLVREHPNYLGKYQKKIYEFISQHENIILDNHTSLSETIINSSLIVLNNSTVGIEALSYYKTVITLGNAYYNREGVVYNLNKKEELKNLITQALKNPIKKENIDIFLYNFLFDYLYIGHFQDQELQSGDKIINDILKSVIK